MAPSTAEVILHDANTPWVRHRAEIQSPLHLLTIRSIAAATPHQCYATGDLGLIAYETQAREGLVLDEGVIVEIVRPGSTADRSPVPKRISG